MLALGSGQRTLPGNVPHEIRQEDGGAQPGEPLTLVHSGSAPFQGPPDAGRYPPVSPRWPRHRLPSIGIVWRERTERRRCRSDIVPKDADTVRAARR